MLAASPQTIVDEIESVQKLLQKWHDRFTGGSIPVIDVPSDEGMLDDFMREFCGELRICAGRCGNLAEVLSTEG